MLYSELQEDFYETYCQTSGRCRWDPRPGWSLHPDEPPWHESLYLHRGHKAHLSTSRRTHFSQVKIILSHSVHSVCEVGAVKPDLTNQAHHLWSDGHSWGVAADWPDLLSKNLMCRSSWAVMVTGSVGWLTTLFIWFDPDRAEEGEKGITLFTVLKNPSHTSYLFMVVCALTAISLSFEHKCLLGSFQVIHNHVSAIKGCHHVSRVTTIEVHWCGDPMLCWQM